MRTGLYTNFRGSERSAAAARRAAEVVLSALPALPVLLLRVVPIGSWGGVEVFRHVVLFRWKPETSDVDKGAVREGLAKLPAEIPEIRAYQFGDDARLADGNFDFAVVADFDSEADYLVYAAHERHQRLIAERIRPLLAERVAVQYAVQRSS